MEEEMGEAMDGEGEKGMEGERREEIEVEVVVGKEEGMRAGQERREEEEGAAEWDEGEGEEEEGVIMEDNEEEEILNWLQCDRCFAIPFAYKHVS
jgi:hypothetical protein